MASIAITILDPPLRKSVTINVTGGPGQIRDYVGVFLAGAATYLDWRYVANGLQTRAPKGSATGVVKFLNLAVGNYEAKLFGLTDAGVATLLQTVPFAVAASVPVTSASSGYGLGSYGQVPWDETLVDSRAWTKTKHLGLFKPLYATAGYGTQLNKNMDIIEAFNLRLVAAEQGAANG